jgi:hypothetical protein
VVRYELLTFAHVAAAIIWLGAGLVLTILQFGAARAGDRARELGYYRDTDWLSARLFIPASLALLLFGVLLVIDGPWRFEDLWIQIGIGGWAASFLVGILYFKPESERLSALMEEKGPEDPEIARRIGLIVPVERLELVILYLVVADMVIKPTADDDAWALIAGAAILALAGILAAVALRRNVSPAPS